MNDDLSRRSDVRRGGADVDGLFAQPVPARFQGAGLSMDEERTGGEPL